MVCCCAKINVMIIELVTFRYDCMPCLLYHQLREMTSNVTVEQANYLIVLFIHLDRKDMF